MLAQKLGFMLVRCFKIVQVMTNKKPSTVSTKPTMRPKLCVNSIQNSVFAVKMVDGLAIGVIKVSNRDKVDHKTKKRALRDWRKSNAV